MVIYSMANHITTALRGTWVPLPRLPSPSSWALAFKGEKLNVYSEKRNNQGFREPLYAKPFRKKCTGFTVSNGNWIW